MEDLIIDLDGNQIKVKDEYSIVECKDIYQEIYKDRFYNINECPMYENDVVIDVGANYGLYSKYALEVTKASKVIAIEPIEFLRKYIEFNNSNNLDKLKVITCAAMAFNGEVGFKINPTESSSSLVSTGSNLSCMVPSYTIDNIVNVENLDRVDFIKIDAEGSDFSAVIGARDTITKFKPRMAICVYHTRHHRKSILKTVLEMNPTYNYKMIKHNENSWTELVYFW